MAEKAASPISPTFTTVLTVPGAHVSVRDLHDIEEAIRGGAAIVRREVPTADGDLTYVVELFDEDLWECARTLDDIGDAVRSFTAGPLQWEKPEPWKDDS